VKWLVEKHLPKRHIYKFVLENSGEVFAASSQNLKRRDRTPVDCGYYMTVPQTSAVADTPIREQTAEALSSLYLCSVNDPCQTILRLGC